MKRIVALLMLFAVIFTALAGCGDADAKDVDFEALAGELTGSDAFSDILSVVPANTVLMLYQLESADMAECLVYCSTGATAEEIALFKATDEAAAARIKTAMETRIDQQIQSFESYVPAEVPKLEKAVVKVSGVFVAYVTAEDAAAAKAILDKYM